VKTSVSDQESNINTLSLEVVTVLSTIESTTEPHHLADITPLVSANKEYSRVEKSKNTAGEFTTQSQEEIHIEDLAKGDENPHDRLLPLGDGPKYKWDSTSLEGHYSRNSKLGTDINVSEIELQLQQNLDPKKSIPATCPKNIPMKQWSHKTFPPLSPRSHEDDSVYDQLEAMSVSHTITVNPGIDIETENSTETTNNELSIEQEYDRLVHATSRNNTNPYGRSPLDCGTNSLKKRPTNNSTIVPHDLAQHATDSIHPHNNQYSLAYKPDLVLHEDRDNSGPIPNAQPYDKLDYGLYDKLQFSLDHTKRKSCAPSNVSCPSNTAQNVKKTSSQYDYVDVSHMSADGKSPDCYPAIDLKATQKNDSEVPKDPLNDTEALEKSYNQEKYCLKYETELHSFP